MNAGKLAHDLIAENKALAAIIKKHRNDDSGQNQAYDILCFNIMYPYIIHSVKSIIVKDKLVHIHLESICVNVDKEDVSAKIYEIMDTISSEYERILLFITICQVTILKPNIKTNLISIMKKYDEFNLVLEICECLN